jgi:hypothetical protein
MTARSVIEALATRLLILGVQVYRNTLRPLLGGQCRFYPTCSEYFLQALRLHGPWRGGLLGLWRILRCHPLGRGGYDPPPPPRQPCK